MPKGEVLAHLLVEQIGASLSHIHFEYKDEKVLSSCVVKNHHEGLEKIISLLSEAGILSSFSALDAIGHRVVHGGEKFLSATLIDERVIAEIEALIPLAPLHNGANLEGILVAKNQAPLVKQVAVFDTAFHFPMPKEAYLYALPYEMYEKHKIRRYGFHGTSHAYILKQSALELKKEASALNIITLHLGNGASACAISQGKSIDTSMGFTPLEGLVMGSRSGDIDPEIVLYMQRELGMSIDEVDATLNKKSGLLGICGENDVRAILEEPSEQGALALAMMTRRIKKYIGSYMALLGEVDAIVFSGGIGENSPTIRERVLDSLACGIEMDRLANEANATTISTPQSKIKLLVIKTNEELEIARESLALLNA